MLNRRARGTRIPSVTAAAPTSLGARISTLAAGDASGPTVTLPQPALGSQASTAAVPLPDPTGPVGLPLGLGIVDPLGPSQPENPPTVQQPDSSVYPIFDTVDGYGWFGSGFARGGVPSRSPQRVAIAVGGDTTTGGRIYVLSSLSKQVSMYDLTSPPAITPMDASKFNSVSWSSTQSIAYYRQEVYVLGVDQATNKQVVKVFDADGNYRRSIQLDNLVLDEGYTGTAGTRYGGLAVAFGEIWLTHAGNSDQAGQDVVVYDAQTGAFKGRSQQPLGGVQSPSYRRWWDISIAPELGGGIVDRRFISQGPVEAADVLPGSPKCLGGASTNCTSGAQQGTDAVWGMRWFMDLSSPAGNNTYRPVQEFSIDQQTLGSSSWPFSLLPGGGFSIGIPGYYLTPQRTWDTEQSINGDTASVSDLFFNNRALRIDWAGYPTTSTWVRGPNHCIPYIVSDADIFIVGDKGERWYQPARGFQQIQFFVDDQLKATFSTPSGQWCMDSTKFADGTHTLKAIATVDGGKQVTKTNPNLHIDNTQPTGGVLTSLGTYSRASVTMAGTLADTSAGPYDWTLQISPAGQGNYTNVGGCTVIANPSGAYTCNWDTTKYADGAFDLRARLRDSAVDASGNVGNTAYTGSVSTTVDNTPPALANFVPDLNQIGEDVATDDISPVRLTQTDATSGIQQTQIQVNDATDGSADGAWHDIGSSSASGDVEMDWSTTDFQPGLHRIRFQSQDRAGNQVTAERQFVIADQRTPFSRQSIEAGDPQADASSLCRGQHCYVAVYPPTRYALTFGIQGTLRVPSVNLDQNAPQFSVDWFGVGSPPQSASLQGGYDSSGCDRNYREGWYVYSELIRINGKQYLDCPSKTRPRPTGETNSFSVRVYRDPRRYEARIYRNGGLEYVDSAPTSGRVGQYWIGTYGRRNTQATAETTWRGRRNIGYFSSVQISPSGPDAFVNLTGGVVRIDYPYQIRVANGHQWCASGPKPGSGYSSPLGCTP